MDRATFAWLLTPEGQSILTRAQELVGTDTLRAATELRRTTTADRASAAMTIIELREHARAKFGAAASRMYFTRDGLEQATRLKVSEHRAARIAAAEPASVIDLGCGIGGDLIAFAHAGLTVAGVDRDPLRVDIATANLAALDLPGAVMEADATTLDHAGFGIVFADPARRTDRGRTFDVGAYQPSWEFVTTLFDRPSCVKVAPGIPHELIPDGAEGEWVSVDGEVKEAALWSGYLATTRRRATVISRTGLATLTEDDDPGGDVRVVGSYLYEPDGAVIRAGLVTAVAALTEGGLLDPHIAYVTSDQAHSTPYATGYAVLDVLPYQEKQLKAALRERGIGRLTIKKRGVDVVPEQLRKRLDLRGDGEATIVLTRVDGSGRALLVEPLQP